MIQVTNDTMGKFKDFMDKRGTHFVGDIPTGSQLARGGGEFIAVRDILEEWEEFKQSQPLFTGMELIPECDLEIHDIDHFPYNTY